ncbi:MAG: ankyrin repeat domain-containing protein [Polyangiaceae bacterium]|nr:ankyrin repeat domain-containing protein [Polyangiaceae bacterium]
MSDALLEAIEAGNIDRLAELLAAGADANATVISRYYTLEFRLTPLLVAVRALQTPGASEPGCSIDTVVLLLRYGADVNRWDEEHASTPLLTAVFNNHIDAVRILLAAGADPNVRGDEGESPLRLCAEKGYLAMARLLLHCGANKTIHEGGGPAGMNALGFAATRLNVEMVKLLLAHGADPHVGDADDITVFERLQFTVELGRVPEDPAAQERLREIRALLGDPGIPGSTSPNL